MSESYKLLQSILLIGLGATLSTFSYLPYGSIYSEIFEAFIWELLEFKAIILLILTVGVIGLEMIMEDQDLHIHLEAPTQE